MNEFIAAGAVPVRFLPAAWSLKEGETPLVTLFAAARASDIPATYETFVEPPLTIRTRDGGVDPGERSGMT